MSVKVRKGYYFDSVIFEDQKELHWWLNIIENLDNILDNNPSPMKVMYIKDRLTQRIEDKKKTMDYFQKEKKEND